MAREQADEIRQPSYSGVQSFLKAESTTPDELDADADVAALGVPFDGSVSRQPGTRYGPEALRRASAWYRGFDGGNLTVETGRVADYGDIEIRDCGDANVFPTDVKRTRDSVMAAVEAVADRAFPVVLGGDHYLTYPSFVGYANTVGEQVGLIHLDAHSDTYGEMEPYGGHWHGSPMSLIDDSAYGGYENHAMIGIRSRETPGFFEFVEEEGLHVSYAHDVRDEGIDACVEAAIEHATDGTDRVYLTVDIDSVDPAFAPGTGTPEPGGLTSADFLRAMDLLGEVDAIGAMDLVEVAPRLDPTNQTHRLGANAIARFLEARFL